MTSTHTNRHLASAIFLGCLALYFSLPTRDLYWDGASFALAVDHPTWFSGIAPNHPLYIGFGRAVHSLLQNFAPNLGGLGVLQGLNAVLGAIAVAVFYLIGNDLLADPLDSALLAGLFALSATWWKFATDANAYIPPVLVLLVAARFLLPLRKPRPLLLALLHTCAMLFHELAVLFVVPAVVGLYLQGCGNRRAGIRNVLIYLATAFVTSAAGYFAFFHADTGQNSLAAFLRWITYHSPDSSFSFEALQSAWLTLRGTGRLFVGGRLTDVHSGMFIKLGILLAVVAIGMIFVRRAKPAAPPAPHREIVQILASWILAYVAFLFFWLPQNTFYRLFYLPPLLLLAAVLWRPRIGRTAMYAAVALVGTWNFVFFIKPHSEIENNIVARSALAMRSVWKPGTWVYTGTFNPDSWTIFCFNPQVMFKGLNPATLSNTAAELKTFNQAGHETWIDRSGVDLLQSEPDGRQWLAEHTRAGFERDYSDANHKLGFNRLFP